jgi:CHAT domain-containing protein
MHGQYVRHDPHNSHLILNNSAQATQERLPAWFLEASNPLRFIVLAACETATSGQAAQGLLGMVGIAPMLVAAGSHAVIGTLWRCDQAASLFFNHYLYAEARRAGKATTWLDCVKNAQRHLREMDRAEFKRLLLEIFEDKFRGFDKEGMVFKDDVTFKAACREIFNDAPYLRKLCTMKEPPAYPFESPYYWAPFVLLGNGNLLVSR